MPFAAFKNNDLGPVSFSGNAKRARLTLGLRVRVRHVKVSRYLQYEAR